MYLYDHWYVAAWADEIGRTPLARTLLDEPVVLYRTEAGMPVALADRCPHRRVPLSMGKLVGDRLQCHYHGLQFDTSGACVRVPGQDAIPSALCTRAYPVEERHGLIWIWMGAAEEADPASIVDYHWLTDPGWGSKGVRFHVKANWQLIVDNLLDLTHLAFVHESTIGNAAVAENAAVRVRRTEQGVEVTRWMIDKPAPPTYVKAGGFTGNVDRWQIIDFTPPAFLRLHVGATPTGTGAPEGRFEGGINMRNLNLITPETEGTTHYFWAQAHDFQPDNPAVTDLVFEQVKTAFLEDVDVFEAQQRMIDAAPDSPQHDINADAGGIQARRILERLHEQETQARAARASTPEAAE
jgi:phenylpropionate dioxygenase-like ring-hydroxylating dioxygenase large terminal subunit